MALAYTPPGVRVNEVVTPSLSPLIAVPASVCLVGYASGAVKTKTEPVKLTGTSAVTLQGVPADATMVSGSVSSVTNYTDPRVTEAGGYSNSSDYVFNATNHTIARNSSGAIADGTTVLVTYTYTPSGYYKPIRLSNLSDIEDRFGSAWNAAGTNINSPLSFAAACALENGAQDIVLQPLFYNVSGVPTQPTTNSAGTTGSYANVATWADTFIALRDIEDINVLIPVIGQSQTNVNQTVVENVAKYAQDHVKFMRDNQQYIVLVTGEDGTGTTPVTSTDLRTHGTTLAGRYGGILAEQTVVVSPTRFPRSLPNTNGQPLQVGGQYMAAAVGGMIAAREVSASLTRKNVAGFAGVSEFRSKDEKNQDAGAGLMVIEQRGGLVQIRHAVTTATDSVVRRELSVVRAKHRVIESVRDTLETQVIGNVIADGNAPIVITNVVIGVLETLKGYDDIVDYGDVQARTLSLEPTTVEVRFSYRPALPVNYIVVNFALDLTTGDVTTTATDDNASTI